MLNCLQARGLPPGPVPRLSSALKTPAPVRRLFEHASCLTGQDAQVIASVVSSLMVRVILTLTLTRDLAESTVDELATALKAGCRAQLERDKKG